MEGLASQKKSETAEHDAVDQYLKDPETTRQDTNMKTQKRTSQQEKMEGLASQKKSETAEHDAVDQYLKDLEPACGTGDSSYGDRKQARSDEITALRKAQGILTEAFRAKG